MKKIFTIIIVLYPILNMYATPIPFVSISDFLLITWCMVNIFNSIKNNGLKLKISIPFFMLFMYLFFQLLILVIFKEQEYISKIFLPTIRLLFYFGNIAFFMKEYFLLEYGLKIFKYCTMFVSYFLIFQKISLDVFGIYISGTLDFLPVMSEDILKYNDTMSEVKNGRLRSVFMEPSHFAIYVSLYLSISMNYLRNSWLKVNLPIMVALLISGSSTGIFMLIIITVWFLLKLVRKISFKKFCILFVFVLLFLVGLLIYIQTESFKIFYERTFVNQSAIDGRFSNYDLIFNTEQGFSLSTIFGNGILKIEQYISTFPRIYLYFGVIGLLGFAVYMITYIIRLKGISRNALLILIILSTSSELFFGHFILLYMAIIVSGNKEEKNGIIGKWN